MVDESICTDRPVTCDVATMTDDVIVGGETDSYEAPPADYNYRTPPEEHAEWCNPYIYGPEVYDWCISYVYITPPAYLAAWFYGTPKGPM